MFTFAAGWWPGREDFIVKGCVLSRRELGSIRRGCGQVLRDIGRYTIGTNEDRGTIHLVYMAGAIRPPCVGGTLRLNTSLVNRGEIRRCLKGGSRLRLGNIRHRLVNRLRAGGIHRVVNRISVVRSISSFGLTGRVSEISTTGKLVAGYLTRIGVNVRRDGDNLDPTRLRRALCVVSRLPGVEVGNLVTVPPIYRDRTSRHGCFTRLHRSFVSVGSGGVSGVSVRVLSVNVDKSCGTTVTRNSSVIEINSTVFNTEGCCWTKERDG